MFFFVYNCHHEIDRAISDNTLAVKTSRLKVCLCLCCQLNTSLAGKYYTIVLQNRHKAQLA